MESIHICRRLNIVSAEFKYLLLTQIVTRKGSELRVPNKKASKVVRQRRFDEFNIIATLLLLVFAYEEAERMSRKHFHAALL